MKYLVDDMVEIIEANSQVKRNREKVPLIDIIQEPVRANDTGHIR